MTKNDRDRKHLTTMQAVDYVKIKAKQLMAEQGTGRYQSVSMAVEAVGNVMVCSPVLVTKLVHLSWPDSN
jgi:hypothetical protein